MHISTRNNTDAINIVNRCETDLKIVPGATGKIILNKFNSVISKNDGYQIHNVFALLKFVPVTSDYIERSFSAYKEILSDRRQKFSVENLEKYLVIK
ncbi:hypothetical protein FQA39_LY14923 [Lamprigera yunnana]|nr:hypothetical protein FQA39_LY14923 [Lamprigera yunnana]